MNEPIYFFGKMLADAADNADDNVIISINEKVYSIHPHNLRQSGLILMAKASNESTR